MKRFFTMLALTCVALFSSCSDEYDDLALRQDIADLGGRITALEELCNTMNNNISALQSIVTALQQRDYIKSIEPIVQNGKEIGYRITFMDADPITIYHGQDGNDGNNGVDGKAPVVGVKQDTDGTYYWTIDGEWMTDAAGNKLAATGMTGADGEDGQDGQDGNDGQDGVTPQFKIEDGLWYVSYDDGQTWVELGQATGDDGQNSASSSHDCIFSDISEDGDFVHITLADDTRLSIPKASGSLVTSLIYIPEYDDGAIMPTTDQTITMSFEVLPKRATATIEQSMLELMVITSKTRAEEPTSLEITKFESDADAGVITITASTKNIPEECKRGYLAAKVSLVITIGDESISSKYVPIIFDAAIKDNQIWYTTSDNVILSIPTGHEIAEGLNIVSHTYSKDKGVITFDATIETIAIRAFDSEQNSDTKRITSITLPSKVKRIGSHAFHRCTSLSSILLPEGLEELADNVFTACESLKTITLPQTVTTIGENIFAQSALEEITLPNKITTIIGYAFAGCTNLHTVVLPKELKGISAHAFIGCTALKSIVIPNNVTSIDTRVFAECHSLESVVLSNSLQKIPTGVFENCTSLKTITIPSSVDRICEKVFYGCSSLEKVTIFNGLTRIDNLSFADCTSLKEITIPESVTEIMDYVFNGCTALTTVYSKAVTPPSALVDNSSILGNVDKNLRIIVPTKSVDAYKKEWVLDKDYIIGEETDVVIDMKNRYTEDTKLRGQTVNWDGITFIVGNKLTANNNNSQWHAATNKFRLYKGEDLTIKHPEGKALKSVVIYAGEQAFRSLMTADVGTVSVDDTAHTITWTAPANSDVKAVTLNASETQIRISNFTVTYSNL